MRGREEASEQVTGGFAFYRGSGGGYPRRRWWGARRCQVGGVGVEGGLNFFSGAEIPAKIRSSFIAHKYDCCVVTEISGLMSHVIFFGGMRRVSVVFVPAFHPVLPLQPYALAHQPHRVGNMQTSQNFLENQRIIKSKPWSLF